MLTVGSLFSGIGGFDLGLERAGMRTLWLCEADPYARRVLERHWPGVSCYPDVRELRGADVEPVDVLAGGFPCQDLSYAGKGAGINGTRSGLWAEYARLIRDIRPRYVIVENVPALLARGMGRVLGDLAACGYDAEWDCIPASAVGAPHRRDRVWIVAYPQGQRLEGLQRTGSPGWESEDAASDRGRGPGTLDQPDSMARTQARQRNGTGGPVQRPGTIERAIGSVSSQGDHWLAEPDVGRVAHGIPDRVHRLRALGNALVPQIAELIGRGILDYERARWVT